MLTLSVILMMTDPRSMLMRAGGAARARQSVATMSALRFTLKRAIIERSVEELRIIRFQRSYTSGWSGAVKFPAGLDMFSAIEADISRVSAEQKRERAAKRTRREAAAKSETGSTRRKGKAVP